MSRLVCLLTIPALLALLAAPADGKRRSHPLKFEVVYTGNAHYTSNRTVGCLQEREQDYVRWRTTYTITAHRKGKADYISRLGNTRSVPVDRGWVESGSGCGNPFSCAGESSADVVDDPRLNATPADERRALKFEAEAAKKFRVHDVTGSESCADNDGDIILFPAYRDHMPSMLEARFTVSLKALRRLKRGDDIERDIALKPDQYPPYDCSRSGTHCTEALDMDGKVRVKRVR